jgi:protein O-GlcNAc transferase
MPLHLITFLVLAQATAARPVEPPEYVRSFHAGNYPLAAALAAERLKAQPGDIRARILLARTEAAMGRFDAAYAGFRQALRLEPHNVDALYYLEVTAGLLAQGEFERLLAVAPESARAHQLRGQNYRAQEKTTEAEAEFTAALEAGPPTAEVLTALGDLRRTKLDLATARAYYSRAAELAPGNYDALYGIGACDSYAGDHRTAVGFFRRALRVAPGSAPARLALGISLLQTGETTAAVTELEEAARLEPRMRQAYYQLGRAYQILGRPQESNAAFARVQELIQEERQGAVNRLDPEPNPR